jgi:hypothetical protein
MQQEAAYELSHRQRHWLIAAAALGAVVLELEGDPALIAGDEAAVGDGHPVGVARQIGEHRFGAGEGALGIDHPLARAQRCEPCLERRRRAQAGLLAEELQLPVTLGGAELRAEQAAEQPREDPHGEEEAARAGNPAFAIQGDPAPGHDAMHMGVMGQGRAPGVQHQGHADTRPQVLGVGGDGEQGFGGSRKQQAVDHRLVVIGDLPDRCWQGEDHVVVLHRQQVCHPGGQPLLGNGPLTLGAMTVATGVVGDLAVAAVGALRDMAAERCGAAALDGRHHLQLAEAQVPGLLPAPSGAVVAEDVRDLQGLAWHGRPKRAGAPVGASAPGGWSPR